MAVGVIIIGWWLSNRRYSEPENSDRLRLAYTELVRQLVDLPFLMLLSQAVASQDVGLEVAII